MVLELIITHLLASKIAFPWLVISLDQIFSGLPDYCVTCHPNSQLVYQTGSTSPDTQWELISVHYMSNMKPLTVAATFIKENKEDFLEQLTSKEEAQQ